MEDWPGVVKIKMLHRAGATVLLPDLVIIGGAGNQWVQPRFVHSPLLVFTDDAARATIWFAALDPSHRSENGLKCKITFGANDRRTALADRSEVYSCRVETAHSPAQLAIGRARLRRDGGVDVRLYHHTARETLPLIHSSGHVLGSTWNYQGTRELTNVNYAYFTSLRSIGTEADLRRIAMASNGKIALRLDRNPGSSPDLLLDVYRASTRDRKATLKLWVPGEAVSTPHVWQHAGMSMPYEITHPWIYRVGLEPGAQLGFRLERARPDPAMLRRFDYAVIGDCTTIGGLEAPFDEENTKETFVVQDLAGSNLFDFWREHPNTRLHTPPSATQEFKP